MSHRFVGAGSMPVFLPRFEHDRLSSRHSLYLSTPFLREARAGENDQQLWSGVKVPVGPGSWLKLDPKLPYLILAIEETAAFDSDVSGEIGAVSFLPGHGAVFEEFHTLNYSRPWSRS